jgi:hypothetical protein
VISEDGRIGKLTSATFEVERYNPDLRARIRLEPYAEDMTRKT